MKNSVQFRGTSQFLRYKMKSVLVLFLFGIVGYISACQVSQKITVQHSKLSGIWYEKLSLGDSVKVFFDKCMKNEISIDASSKTRSYVWKWFPWITWTSKSTLADKGTKWEISEKGPLGIGTRTHDLGILALESDFVILKTCPNQWLAHDERVWVYWRTNANVGKDELARVQKALDDSGSSYKVGDFKAVNQANC